MEPKQCLIKCCLYLNVTLNLLSRSSFHYVFNVNAFHEAFTFILNTVISFCNFVKVSCNWPIQFSNSDDQPDSTQIWTLKAYWQKNLISKIGLPSSVGLTQKFDKGHLLLFNHFIDMRTTVSLSISCRKNVFLLIFSNKNTFFLHEMDSLTVGLMSIKWII